MPEATKNPVGHKTLRLRDIDPHRSPAFSPNLHAWMRSKAHFYREGGVAESVFRVKPDTQAAVQFGAGTLFIGYPMNGHPGDTDFSGARLMQVLCNGTKAGRWCFAGIAPDLEEVEGVWGRYLHVGRCAIDPGHHEHFSGGERYRFEGALRTCLWCGATHTRVLTPRTVMDESWV